MTLTDFDEMPAGMFPYPGEFAEQAFGIYPRVSTQVQATDDKASLDAQIAACTAYGERLGMILDPMCVRKEAHTSTTTDRPELNALLREMKSRGVKNLVVDRVDRLTREGRLAAAQLLQRFTDSGILLHIASYSMVIRDEMGVGSLMDMASAARMAHEARTRSRIEAMRYDAVHKGRYVRGSRPPYGYLWETLEKDARGRATKVRLVADRRVVNGFEPWEVRRRICQEYLAGRSAWRIAERLSTEGVPTSRQLAGHQGAVPYWDPSTIRDILLSPLNYGEATTFRQRVVSRPPDSKHLTRWKVQVDVPVDKQISIPGMVADPVISQEEAKAIEALIKTGRQRSPRNDTLAQWALLRGGMAHCAVPRPDDPTKVCGASLRVKWTRNKLAGMQYVCRLHELQPTRCPGVTFRRDLLDSTIWANVCYHLTHPEKLRELAEAQIAREVADDPSSHLTGLKRIKVDLERQATNLASSIATTDDAFSRGTLQRHLEQTGVALWELEEDIMIHERLVADAEQQQELLRNVQYQMDMHRELVWELPDAIGLFHERLTLEHVRLMRTILQSLGVQVSVGPGDAEGPGIDITYNLGAATKQPWFPTRSEVAVAVRDSR
jgi:DNA invertase Pin-like site-specific DNA recombinase